MVDGPFVIVSLSEMGGGTFTEGLRLWPNSEVEEEEFRRGSGGFGVRGDTLLGGRGGGGSSFTLGDMESLGTRLGGRGGGLGKNDCTLSKDIMDPGDELGGYPISTGANTLSPGILSCGDVVDGFEDGVNVFVGVWFPITQSNSESSVIREEEE